MGFKPEHFLCSVTFVLSYNKLDHFCIFALITRWRWKIALNIFGITSFFSPWAEQYIHWNGKMSRRKKKYCGSINKNWVWDDCVWSFGTEITNIYMDTRSKLNHAQVLSADKS